VTGTWQPASLGDTGDLWAMSAGGVGQIGQPVRRPFRRGCHRPIINRRRTLPTAWPWWCSNHLVCRGW